MLSLRLAAAPTGQDQVGLHHTTTITSPPTARLPPALERLTDPLSGVWVSSYVNRGGQSTPLEPWQEAALQQVAKRLDSGQLK